MRRQYVLRGSAAVFLAGWFAAIVAQGQEQTKDGRGLVRRTEAAGTSDRGRKWAVIIGVNEYIDSKFPQLRYCVADAHLVADKLVERCGYDKDRILLIADDQKLHLRPSRLNLQNWIPKWLMNAELGDTVLVFFAGHGFIDDDRQHFLAPQDCQTNNLGLSGFRTSELRECFASAKQRRKFSSWIAAMPGQAGPAVGPVEPRVRCFVPGGQRSDHAGQLQ